MATSRRPTLWQAYVQFPQPEVQAGYDYPDDVRYDGIRRPQHLDIHGEKALLEVKNGLTTGTIVGRATGLESFTRTHTKYDIKHTSIEVAILRHDKQRGPFLSSSESGDSGSIVLDRAARIVGLLIGSGGTTEETA